MPLQRKTKTVIFISIILLIIAFVIVPLCSRIYIGLIAKDMFSKDKMPNVYILPVERKIIDVENQTQDNYKINYDNFIIKLPWKGIEQRNDSAKEDRTTLIIIDKSKGKGLSISMRRKNNEEKGTSFETYSKMFNMTPGQINFFSTDIKYHEKLLLLGKKSTCKFYDGSIYKFERDNIKGFQLGDPSKSKFVEAEIFDKNDNQYQLNFIEFSQKEIDYILASIRFNNE